MLNLPDELALKILDNLNFNELVRCSFVSHEWRRLAEDGILWKGDCLHEFLPHIQLGLVLCSNLSQNWRNNFLRFTLGPAGSCDGFISSSIDSLQIPTTVIDVSGKFPENPTMFGARSNINSAWRRLISDSTSDNAIVLLRGSYGSGVRRLAYALCSRWISSNRGSVIRIFVRTSKWEDVLSTMCSELVVPDASSSTNDPVLWKASISLGLSQSNVSLVFLEEVYTLECFRQIVQFFQDPNLRCRVIVTSRSNFAQSSRYVYCVCVKNMLKSDCLDLFEHHSGMNCAMNPVIAEICARLSFSPYFTRLAALLCRFVKSYNNPKTLLKRLTASGSVDNVSIPKGGTSFVDPRRLDMLPDVGANPIGWPYAQHPKYYSFRLMDLILASLSRAQKVLLRAFTFPGLLYCRSASLLYLNIYFFFYSQDYLGGLYDGSSYVRPEEWTGIPFMRRSTAAPSTFSRSQRQNLRIQVDLLRDPSIQGIFRQREDFFRTNDRDGEEVRDSVSNVDDDDDHDDDHNEDHKPISNSIREGEGPLLHEDRQQQHLILMHLQQQQLLLAAQEESLDDTATPPFVGALPGSQFLSMPFQYLHPLLHSLMDGGRPIEFATHPRHHRTAQRIPDAPPPPRQLMDPESRNFFSPITDAQFITHLQYVKEELFGLVQLGLLDWRPHTRQNVDAKYKHASYNPDDVPPDDVDDDKRCGGVYRARNEDNRNSSLHDCISYATGYFQMHELMQQFFYHNLVNLTEQNVLKHARKHKLPDEDLIDCVERLKDENSRRQCQKEIRLELKSYAGYTLICQNHGFVFHGLSLLLNFQLEMQNLNNLLTVLLKEFMLRTNRNLTSDGIVVSGDPLNDRSGATYPSPTPGSSSSNVYRRSFVAESTVALKVIENIFLQPYLNGGSADQERLCAAMFTSGIKVPQMPYLPPSPHSPSYFAANSFRRRGKPQKESSLDDIACDFAKMNMSQISSSLPPLLSPHPDRSQSRVPTPSETAVFALSSPYTLYSLFSSHLCECVKKPLQISVLRLGVAAAKLLDKRSKEVMFSFYLGDLHFHHYRIHKSIVRRESHSFDTLTRNSLLHCLQLEKEECLMAFKACLKVLEEWDYSSYPTRAADLHFLVYSHFRPPFQHGNGGALDFRSSKEAPLKAEAKIKSFNHPEFLGLKLSTKFYHLGDFGNALRSVFLAIEILRKNTVSCATTECEGEDFKIDMESDFELGNRILSMCDPLSFESRAVSPRSRSQENVLMSLFFGNIAIIFLSMKKSVLSVVSSACADSLIRRVQVRSLWSEKFNAEEVMGNIRSSLAGFLPFLRGTFSDESSSSFASDSDYSVPRNENLRTLLQSLLESSIASPMLNRSRIEFDHQESKRNKVYSKLELAYLMTCYCAALDGDEIEIALECLLHMLTLELFRCRHLRYSKDSTCPSLFVVSSNHVEIVEQKKNKKQKHNLESKRTGKKKSGGSKEEVKENLDGRPASSTKAKTSSQQLSVRDLHRAEGVFRILTSIGSLLAQLCEFWSSGRCFDEVVFLQRQTFQAVSNSSNPEIYATAQPMFDSWAAPNLLVLKKQVDRVNTFLSNFAPIMHRRQTTTFRGRSDSGGIEEEEGESKLDLSANDDEWDVINEYEVGFFGLGVSTVKHDCDLSLIALAAESYNRAGRNTRALLLWRMAVSRIRLLRSERVSENSFCQSFRRSSSLSDEVFSSSLSKGGSPSPVDPSLHFETLQRERLTRLGELENACVFCARESADMVDMELDQVLFRPIMPTGA